MSKENLNLIISKLQQKPNLQAVTITDISDSAFPRVLHRNIFGNDMIEKSGSINAFLNDLLGSDSKLNRISIQLRYKNGTSFINGETYEFTIKPKQPSMNESQSVTVMQPQQQQQQLPVYPNNGLMPTGLGGIDNSDLYYRYKDHPKLEVKYEALKEKFEKLKEDNFKLREDIINSKLDDNKAAGQTQLVTTLINAAPQIAAALKGGGAPPIANAETLNGTQQNLTPLQRELVNFVSSQDDGFNTYLKVVAAGLTQSEGFIDELEAVLKKHELIQ